MHAVRPRPSAEQIAARKAEIAARYKRKAKGKQPRTIAAIRISELTRLFDDRYGRVHLPESDDCLMAARIMAHHLGALPHADRRIATWLMTCTPWMRLAERERLITEVTECPLRWRANKLGWKLRVTDAERLRLKITTIAPYDVSQAERLARRLTRRRLASQAARRARGAKPRGQYELLSVSRLKPWATLGMSRRSWYRAGKPSP